MTENREELITYLQNKGIETNVHYPTPIYRQGAYKEYLAEADDYPVTENICRQEVSIPLYPGLTEEEQDYIIHCLNEWK